MDDAVGDVSNMAGAPRSPSRFAWLGVGILATIVFELTAEPVFVVTVGCMKFGWDEMATSRWLRRVDPDRIRGKICSHFYAGWALWRVAMVAVALIVIIVMVHERLRRNGLPVGGPPASFDVGVQVMLIGLFLAAAVSTLALFSAWRRGVPIWVGPEANRARRSGSWPPSLGASYGPGTNRVRIIMISTIVADLVLIGMPLTILADEWFQAKFVRGLVKPAGGEVPAAILIGAILLAAAGGCWLQSYLGRRIIADSPYRCWSLEASYVVGPD